MAYGYDLPKRNPSRRSVMVVNPGPGFGRRRPTAPRSRRATKTEMRVGKTVKSPKRPGKKRTEMRVGKTVGKRAAPRRSSRPTVTGRVVTSYGPGKKKAGTTSRAKAKRNKSARRSGAARRTVRTRARASAPAPRAHRRTGRMATTRYGRVVGGRKRRNKTTRRPKRRRNVTKALPPARKRPSKPQREASSKRKDPKRVRAGKKAAATRKRREAARRRAAQKAARTRKRGGRRRPGRYRVKASKGRKSYLRRYPVRRKRGGRRRPGRYRVKASKGRKSYLRRYPVRRKRRKAAAKRRTRRAAPKRRRTTRRKRPVFGRVWRKGYSYKHPRSGKIVRVKGRYVKKGGGKKRRAATRRRRPRRYRVHVKRGKLAGRSYLRRYPKRRGKRRAAPRRRKRQVFGRVWRKGYSYKHPRSGKIVRVKGRYVKKGGRRKGARRAAPRRRAGALALRTGTYVANPGGYGRSWIGRRGAALGMASNPGALAMLPTVDQLKMVGKAAGVTFVGFAGAAAAGRALTGVGMVRQYLGVWTPVAGNVLSGLAFWAIAHYAQNPKLDAMKPYVMVGAGLAAIVNIARNLVAANVVPARYASWVMPGAQGAAVSVAEEVPEAAVGQIDVYEAALDGLGGIEEELEAELDRLGMYQGSEGIFGAYETVPLGAEVEEAFAAYETVPLGAEVEELTAGLGAYETTDLPTLGAEVEQAFSAYETVPLGAEVEEAFAGLGQNNANAAANGWAEFEQSLKAAPLMPGFRAAIQRLVRKRIAEGQPIDNAFYNKLGRAAAKLAERKVAARMRSARGLPGMPPQTDRWRPPVTNMAAPKRRAIISPDVAAPGEAGGIPDVEAEGGPEFQGILTGSTLGIFD